VNQPNRNKSPLLQLLNFSVISVFGKVSLLTIIIAAGSALLGWWLDGMLGTRPWLMIILFVASFPFAMFAIYWVVKSSIPNTPTSAQSADPYPEENHSDRKAP